MYNEQTYDQSGAGPFSLPAYKAGRFNLKFAVPRKAILGLILLVALLAFEIFNYSTTQFALQSLLGDVSFLGLQWAVVLAVAFCAIDFAGLARLFTPEQGADEPRAIWYLMGAWLLGATMNAIMTWWAVNLTLLSHEFGNEVLSRQQLLRYTPLLVAALVWITRILFIGAFSMTGEHLFDFSSRDDRAGERSQRSSKPKRVTQSPDSGPRPVPTGQPAPQFAQSGRRPRAPRPGPALAGMQARPRR